MRTGCQAVAVIVPNHNSVTTLRLIATNNIERLWRSVLMNGDLREGSSGTEGHGKVFERHLIFENI